MEEARTGAAGIGALASGDLRRETETSLASGSLLGLLGPGIQHSAASQPIKKGAVGREGSGMRIRAGASEACVWFPEHEDAGTLTGSEPE